MKQEGKYLVEFFDGEDVQKGIVYPDDQLQAFSNYRKVMVRLVDDNLKPKIDEHGNKIVSLRAENELQIVGFVD